MGAAVTPWSLKRAGLRWLALAATLALAGCNAEWVNSRDRFIQANTQPPGPNYKAEIIAFMRTYLNDPVGVRDAFIDFGESDFGLRRCRLHVPSTRYQT